MVVAVKVFKKTTPNGKVTVYLSKRDFIDYLDHVDPIDGVIVVEDGYLQGRKIYGQVVTTYRYGREEDEVMGLKFSKEMVIAQDQIAPAKKSPDLTPVQEKLVKKMGTTAYPFIFKFPEMAPSSVTLQPGEDDQGKPLGVEYFVKIYVAANEEDKGHKRSTVTLAIKKLQMLSQPRIITRLPSSVVSKGFTFSSGKINLEVTLDREIYYHGEQIGANITISNNSRKSVRNIKVYAVQHCEVTMVNAQFSKYVASLETREGCPITPGTSFTKTIYLVPLASSNKDRRGIALDGRLRDDDVNLASSTLVPDGKCPIDAIGIVISYSMRVKLDCGTLGGELVTDVPFKLLHPGPGAIEKEKPKTFKKMRSMEKARYANSYEHDDDDNIVFEDFARFRLSRDGIE
ncbi:arrestin 2 [Tribolium castaneum]|uniref:Phosrestin-1 n=1 Tax=Tribolium castaneum TaxID=7070 RepID=D6WSE6_TRICA|nr:arrestin 2 [Tribolium castaneum]EFA07498.1 arrestin 2 [Tribolium castaneum]|eukprot:NP_001164084.1 arrestin 2 [Tribolium castaneum]